MWGDDCLCPCRQAALALQIFEGFLLRFERQSMAPMIALIIIVMYIQSTWSEAGGNPRGMEMSTAVTSVSRPRLYCRRRVRFKEET